MELKKQHKCHGGTISYYSHESIKTKSEMNFAIFLPKDVQEKMAYVIFLSGLTCTEDNFTTKANAFKKASELGIAILIPDTSPRGNNIPDHEDYDLGQGAGFYINATQKPWAENFQMESYIIDELIPLTENKFNLDKNKKSIMGHSMGGHGAITLFLKYKNKFKSCSAFSPIIAPSQVPWGKKAFLNYLGQDKNDWLNNDACHLAIEDSNAKNNPPILIDQGLDDNFLKDQLKSELFEQACKEAGQSLELRMQEGYDHSYFFIQSFINQHLKFHAKYLIT